MWDVLEHTHKHRQRKKSSVILNAEKSKFLSHDFYQIFWCLSRLFLYVSRYDWMRKILMIIFTRILSDLSISSALSESLEEYWSKSIFVIFSVFSGLFENHQRMKCQNLNLKKKTVEYFIFMKGFWKYL